MSGDSVLPQYPVYVISKGRADICLTANMLVADGVPFHLVVEPPEYDQYASRYGKQNVYELPFADLGLGSIPARNWVWEHARASGAERHWILDDNIRTVRRVYRGKRIPCASGPALRVVEDFTDRYENVAISGMNYSFFIRMNNIPPFHLNCRVYSSILIKNDLPNRWRGRYNEDADLCLQVLADGWCTVLVNAFTIEKVRTQTMKGGNTDSLYQGDGRLKMARSLERVWPGVVEVDRRFQRPQHVVKDAWRRFDTPLKRKPDVVIPDEPNEYGLTLKEVRPVQSDDLKKLLPGKEESRK